MEEFVFAVVETSGIISQIGGRVLHPHRSEQLSSFITFYWNYFTNRGKGVKSPSF